MSSEENLQEIDFLRKKLKEKDAEIKRLHEIIMFQARRDEYAQWREFRSENECRTN
jgi:hypothetical protein